MQSSFLFSVPPQPLFFHSSALFLRFPLITGKNVLRI